MERVTLNALRSLWLKTTFARWTPPVRPIILFRAQSFHHRIAADVMPFLQRLGLRADTVVEIITLPLHLLNASCTALPITNHPRHARIVGKPQQGVKMIRHQQEQLTPPQSGDMILACRLKECRSDSEEDEWRRLAGGADTHMKQSARPHPWRRAMMQSLRIILHTG